jgi:hypothetical protein
MGPLDGAIMHFFHELGPLDHFHHPFFFKMGPVDGAIMHFSISWVRESISIMHFFLKDIQIKSIIKRNKEIIYIKDKC